MTEPSWRSAHDANVLSAKDQHGLEQVKAIRKQLRRLIALDADLGKIEADYPRAMRTLFAAAVGSPGAQSYDGVGRGGTTRTHCWEHNQDFEQCKLQRGDKERKPPLTGDCRPETMPVNDPAGEAALWGDKAERARHAIRRRIDRLAKETDALTSDVNDANPAKRAPTDKDRRETANSNAPHCQSCARIQNMTGTGPRTELPRWLNTTIKGNLPEPMALCRWCGDFVSANGKLPTKQQLEQHQLGVTVKVTA